MLISSETLNEIRRRADLVAMVSARVALKRAGGLYKACCPFHQERTPSFHVYPDQQNFHCFGCQAHGDVIDFVMRTQGMTFMDAVRQLAEQSGIPLETESDGSSELRKRLIALHQELADFYHRCLWQSAQATAARAYLAERQIGKDAIESFQIGYAPRNGQTLATWASRHDRPEDLLEVAGMRIPGDTQDGSRGSRSYDRFRDRLMFPIRDTQGHVIAFSGRRMTPQTKSAKYINSPETPLFQKNRVIYGLDRAARSILGDPHREALICEGQIDVIRCHDHGFNHAVAPLGTAFTEGHVRLLSRYADSVVLAFDGDAAGAKAALRTATLFLQQGIAVRIAELAEGDDPDSLLVRESAAGLRTRIDNALSVVGFNLASLRRAEAKPDGIDAINRMARATLQLVAQCANATQRACLIRETAESLGVPVAAIEEDLQKIRRETPTATAPGSPPATSERSPATTQTKPIQPLKTVQGPFPEEIALCELVCHHDDDIPVIRLIHAYLPLDLISHAPCRTILEAAIQSCLDGTNALSEIHDHADPELKQWFERFVTADHRVAGARDSTPEDAAQHCILKIWRRRLTGEQQNLRSDPNADATVNLQRRIEVVTLIKRLETMDWKSLEPWIRQEIPRLCPALKRAESEHEADT